MRKARVLWCVLTSRNYVVVCDAGMYGEFKKWQKSAFMKALKQMFDDINKEADGDGKAEKSG